MYRLTVKAVSICVLLASFFCATSAASNCETDFQDDPDSSEKFDKTPLENYESYCRYMTEDKALNSTYRTLSKSLDKNNRLLLKQAQRQWIEWRGKKCEAMLIPCGTLGCYGRAHDSCIIQITSDRTHELDQFIKNKNKAVKQKFDFSRK